MRNPLENVSLFKERRSQLSEKIKGSVLLLYSQPEDYKNSTVTQSYRQDSSMYYMTGYEEPNSIFVFRPGQHPETILFVQKKDPAKEIWDGFLYGMDAAQSQFQMDKVYHIDDFDKEIPSLLKGAENLYYKLFKSKAMDQRIEKALKNLKVLQGRTGFGYLPILDSEELIGEFRIFKSELEIQNLKTACDITVQAHLELVKYLRPKMTERELYGFFLYQIMKRGSQREGYGGIFASGANACTLHYVFNDEVCRDGDLLLVDAGAEYNYFSSDITRVYPISGKFNKAQAEVYQGVLNVQKKIIEAIHPGVALKNLSDMAVSLLTDLMLDLGLLTGRKDDIIETLEYKKYYPHGIGHFLGMDVHDVGMYFSKSGEPRMIQPGMVFTVEPGLYIPANDSTAHRELQGIGVRIEDDILVTANGCDILTKDLPKEIASIEGLY